MQDDCRAGVEMWNEMKFWNDGMVWTQTHRQSELCAQYGNLLKMKIYFWIEIFVCYILHKYMSIHTYISGLRSYTNRRWYTHVCIVQIRWIGDVCKLAQLWKSTIDVCMSLHSILSSYGIILSRQGSYTDLMMKYSNFILNRKLRRRRRLSNCC